MMVLLLPRTFLMLWIVVVGEMVDRRGRGGQARDSGSDEVIPSVTYDTGCCRRFCARSERY